MGRVETHQITLAREFHEERQRASDRWAKVFDRMDLAERRHDSMARSLDTVIGDVNTLKPTIETIKTERAEAKGALRIGKIIWAIVGTMFGGAGIWLLRDVLLGRHG